MNKTSEIDLDFIPEGTVKLTHAGKRRTLDKESIIELLDFKAGIVPELANKAPNQVVERPKLVEGQYSIGAIGRKVGALLSRKMVKPKNRDNRLPELAHYLDNWDKVIAARPKSDIVANLNALKEKYPLKEYPELVRAISEFIPKYQALEKEKLPRKPRNGKKRR